ncbi:hypothetical protein, partial [Microcoleus sp.]|uniref:hypothetical protein n=1 Tax=Microcoleus sp. TaxID=44472 RepID=UPI00403EE464
YFVHQEPDCRKLTRIHPDTPSRVSVGLLLFQLNWRKASSACLSSVTSSTNHSIVLSPSAL